MLLPFFFSELLVANIFFAKLQFWNYKKSFLLTFRFYCHQEKFILKKYMNRQTDINSDMRAILVDWLVEVQVNLTTTAILFINYSFRITRSRAW